MESSREAAEWLTHSWRRTSAERLGFDIARLMNIIKHSLSPFPAVVAQLGVGNKTKKGVHDGRKKIT